MPVVPSPMLTSRILYLSLEHLNRNHLKSVIWHNWTSCDINTQNGTRGPPQQLFRRVTTTSHWALDLHSAQGNQLVPTCQKYRAQQTGPCHLGLSINTSLDPKDLKWLECLGYIQIRPWNHFPNFCVSPAPLPAAIDRPRDWMLGVWPQSPKLWFPSISTEIHWMTHWEVLQPYPSSKSIGEISGEKDQWPRSPAAVTLRKAMGRLPSKWSLAWVDCDMKIFLRPCPSSWQWVSSAQQL